MKRILSVIAVFIILSTGAYAEELVTVNLNGAELNFDVPAQIIEGRTMVPLRGIFEALGALVEWSSTTQTVTAERDGTTVVMSIGSESFTVNDEVKKLDVPPQLVDSRTLVPTRAVAESFGAKVGWDDATNTVSIIDDTVYGYGALLEKALSNTKASSFASQFNMYAAVRMNANEINTSVEADIKATPTTVEATISMVDGHNVVEADVYAAEEDGVSTLYMTPHLEHGDAAPTQKAVESINDVADYNFISGNIFSLGTAKAVRDASDLVKYVVTVKGQDILKLVEISKINSIIPADTGLDIVLKNIKNKHTVDVELWIDKATANVSKTVFDLAPLMNQVFAAVGMDSGAAAGEFKVEVNINE